MSQYERCLWPELPERAEGALHEAVQYVINRYDVVGIIAAGTHVSGNPDPLSDLDLFVIHRQPWRQRIQKRFNGIATEVFVNPPSAIRRYFEREERRPSTAHMLSTGFVVLDDDPIVRTLRIEASEWLERPLQLSEAELTWLRYAAADKYENAQDLRSSNRADANRVLFEAVSAMLEYAFLSRGVKLPRTKEYLDQLARLDPLLVQAACSFYRTGDEDERFQFARAVAGMSIGVNGFFEWESPIEHIV